MSAKENSTAKQSPTILIVDDVHENLFILNQILEKINSNTIMANGSTKALAELVDKIPDLILLDIMMPGMDGFELCKKLKASPKTEDIPVIFLTAKTQSKDIAKGFQIGAADYVTKPFKSVELLARVQTQLELKAARDAIIEKNQRLKEKNNALAKINAELEYALKEIKTLRGFLPVCSNCKKIRLIDSDPDEPNAWVVLDTFFKRHTDAQLTHTICPKCSQKLYPELFEEED
ncbi:response regulator [Desulfococcaceae bacterium HSG9]|nr:response regulator [Desulfococcaceae bacterium HSG9]